MNRSGIDRYRPLSILHAAKMTFRYPPSQTFQSGGSCGEKLSSNKAGMIYEADMSTGASSHVKASGGVLENGVKTGSES